MNGASGAAALVNSNEEPAGANCSSGGHKFSFCTDTALPAGVCTSDDESFQSQFICSAANGLSSLIFTSDLAPGAQCTAGGKRVVTCVDSTEVKGTCEAQDQNYQVNFLCNGVNGSSGTDGKNALIFMQDESQGTNCTAGGKKIVTCLDTATPFGSCSSSDTNLQESFICNGVAGASGASGTSGKTALVIQSSILPGAECAAGGQKLVSCTDTEAPLGTCTSSDLNFKSNNVCNGVSGTNGINGTNSLVFTENELAGSNCVSGGQKITVCADTTVPFGSCSQTDSAFRVSYVCNGAQGAQGTAGFIVTVKDSQNATDTRTINIQVQNTNRPPVFSSASNISVNEGNAVSFVASASDPDADALTYTYSCSPSCPSGVSVSNNSFYWATNYSSAGSFTVTFVVNDGKGGSASSTRTITVYNVNRAPSFTLTSLVYYEEGSYLSMGLSSTDPDGDAVTYSCYSGCTSWSHPSGGSVFNYIPYDAGTRDYTITYRAVDSYGAASYQSTTFRVQNVNRAPVLGYSNCPWQDNLPRGAYSGCQMNASDPDGDSITWRAAPGHTCTTSVAMPAYLNPYSGYFYTYVPPASAGSGSCSIRFYACDSSGACSSVWQGSYVWRAY